ncbi:mannosyltransferase family protein [Dactylosporangium darangshiense]|uniref:Integral membrane protein n=1 Tax=Dactylosporangium darangshiense TaxID=579108 RepID=A0ABP8CUN2_9ACTN
MGAADGLWRRALSAARGIPTASNPSPTASNAHPAIGNSGRAANNGPASSNSSPAPGNAGPATTRARTDTAASDATSASPAPGHVGPAATNTASADPAATHAGTAASNATNAGSAPGQAGPTPGQAGVLGTAATSADLRPGRRGPSAREVLAMIATGGGPWRRAVGAGLGVFAASKAGLAAVSALAWIGDQDAGRSTGHIAWLWATRYDSPWFIAISEHGYQYTEDASPAAFFPLYPLMIRLFTPLCLGRSWVAALLVANVALLLALVVLFRLAEHELDRAAAGRTIFYLVAFPTGFFLSAAYNEGLFIALLAATVYCLRREHWWRAGVLGALAAATRSAGILLVAAFAFEYARRHGYLRPGTYFRSQSYFNTRTYVRARSLVRGAVPTTYVGAHSIRRQKNHNVLKNADISALAPVNVTQQPRQRSGEPDAVGGDTPAFRLENPSVGEKRSQRQRLGFLAVLLMPLGLVGVMITDRIAYGDALAFSHTQAAHWGRKPAWPWQAPLAAARAPGPPFTEIWAHNLLELATVAFLAVLLVLSLVGPWRLRRDQLLFPLFGAALLIFMISFPSRFTNDIPYPLYSASRIGLEVFPAFMVLGRIGGRPWLDRVLLMVFVLTQGLLAAHFLHSGWVA